MSYAEVLFFIGQSFGVSCVAGGGDLQKQKVVASKQFDSSEHVWGKVFAKMFN
jgi:hypothetical protein